MAPKKEPTTTASTEEQLEELHLRIDELKSQLAEVARHNQTMFEAHASSIRNLSSRVDLVDRSLPARARALSFEDVETAIKRDPYVEFEVLESWQVRGMSDHLPAGRVVRADHYVYLLDYVRSGLLLGPPKGNVRASAAMAEQSAARQGEFRSAATEAAVAEAEAGARRIRELAEQVKTGKGGTQ